MASARWGTVLAVAAVAAAAALAPRPAAEAGPAGLTVAGTGLLLDGTPFVPRGFNMVGLLTPDWCVRAQTADARANLGEQELAAARAWGATTLRFQVSQRGLADASIARADRDAYLQEVVAGVTMARDDGFVVIVSMQDQTYGCGPAHPLPTAQTVAAWDVLAPAFSGDPSVALELFNEPDNDATAAGWAQWRTGGTTPLTNQGAPAVGHQALVEHLRSLGVPNLLVADVAQKGERSAGLPLLADPAGNLAYAIHPYNYTNGPSWWDQQYGSLAAAAPVVATEWNYLAGGCGRTEERMAPDLLGYLRAHGIGLLGHAFDQVGTLVADWSWTPTQCGTGSGGSGAVLRLDFALRADAESPPTAPADLQATAVGARDVDLSWTAATDDVGVAAYQVLRDGTAVGTAAGTTWSDTTVAPSHSYVYTVRAQDAGGAVGPESGPLAVTTPESSPDTSPPSTPAPLSARLATASQVALSWAAATDDIGVDHYQLSRDGTALTPTSGRSATDSPGPGSHTYSVVAIDAAGNTSAAATATAVVPASAPAGLTGTYFDTATFTTQKLMRTDPTVNFGWGTGSPGKTIGADTFSVRWTGRILPTAAGTWTFYTDSDQGVRLWIDGTLVVDDWTAHTLREKKATATLTANQAHDVRIDYYENIGAATMKLLWSGPGTAKQVVPSGRLLAR
jgi:hypothetical protein